MHDTLMLVTALGLLAPLGQPLLFWAIDGAGVVLLLGYHLDSLGRGRGPEGEVRKRNMSWQVDRHTLSGSCIQARISR